MNENVKIAYNMISTSLRIFNEQCLRQDLKELDPEEYILNLDSLFLLKIETFHTLYDNLRNEFDFFSHGSTSSIILMRNALHHKKEHNLFNSLYKNMFYDGEVDISLYNYNGFIYEFYYKVEDFYNIFNINSFSNHKSSNINLFERDLFFKNIMEEKDENSKYINIIPIFCEAMFLITQYLYESGYTIEEDEHYDGNTYFNHFKNLNLNIKYYKKK
jgi:hypothetical protein